MAGGGTTINDIATGVTPKPCSPGMAALGLAGAAVGFAGAAWTLRLGYAVGWAYLHNEHSPRPFR